MFYFRPESENKVAVGRDEWIDRRRVRCCAGILERAATSAARQVIASCVDHADGLEPLGENSLKSPFQYMSNVGCAIYRT